MGRCEAGAVEGGDLPMRAWACAVVVALLVPAAAAGGALSQTVPEGQSGGQSAGQCGKTDFEAVVNDAGAALRDLTQQNLPVLQGKLRQLKDKRSWSNDDFLKRAEPLVRDETVAGFDKKSEELVARITGGGGHAETTSAAPDCTLLTSLKGDLKLLVETQQAKWTHMLGRVDQELGK
jgi:hypothetical protein